MKTLALLQDLIVWGQGRRHPRMIHKIRIEGAQADEISKQKICDKIYTIVYVHNNAAALGIKEVRK